MQADIVPLVSSDVSWPLLALPFPFLLQVILAELPVVAAYLRDIVDVVASGGVEVSYDTEGVVRMALLEAQMFLFPIGYVTIGLLHCNVGMGLLNLVQKEPSHRGHLRGIPEALVPKGRDRKWMSTVMVVCVAVVAQRDEVVRSVWASVLPLLDVMHLKLLLRSTLPATESVAGLHICLDVLVAELLSLLILGTFDYWILYLLDVEGCRLDDDS